MNNYLIYVLGATAIGKTSISIKLAQHFDAEIVSCDSRQFYKEMSIGTAVPSKAELATVKHHFIQNLSIFDTYSVGQYERDSLKKLDELFLKGNIQVLVGGSGLYANALINGLDDFPDIPTELREQLNTQLEKEGIQKLQNRLKTLDPESYENIEIENPRRLIRALEICLGTGKKYSDYKNKSKAERNFKVINIGLNADRNIIYDRINTRVDEMVKNGLVEEARELYQNRHLNALQTVGYKELFHYFDGNYSLTFAIDEIKKNTRRFAKRQLTWNRKIKNVDWFDYDESQQKIIETIETIITNE